MPATTAPVPVYDVVSLFQSDYASLFPIPYLSQIENFFAGLDVSSLRPIGLGSTKVDLVDGAGREVIVNGANLSLPDISLGSFNLGNDFGSLSDALDTLNSGAAGTLNSIVLKDNGVTVASLSLTPTTLTLTSGEDTLTFKGSFPTSLAQVKAAVDALFNSSTGKIVAAVSANNPALSGFKFNSITAAVAGVTQASLTMSGSSVKLSSNGYTFDIVGVLPTDMAQIAHVALAIRQGLASDASHIPATGYSLSSASLVDAATGEKIGTLNFSGLDLGKVVGATKIPAGVQLSFTDTAGDIAKDLDALEAREANISGIGVSDPAAPIVITPEQFARDSAILKKITGAHVVDAYGYDATAGQDTYTQYSYNSAGLLTSTTSPASPPWINIGQAATTTDLETAVDPFAGVTIYDPPLFDYSLDSDIVDTLKIALSGSGGVLSDGDGFSGLEALAGGGYELKGAASQVQAELRALVFTPNAAWPNSTGTTRFTLTDTATSSSGNLASADGTAGVNSSAPAVTDGLSVIDNEPSGAITISANYFLANIAGIGADAKVTSVTLTGLDGALAITIQDALDETAALGKLPSTVKLTLADSAANIDALTSAEIAKLAARGYSAISVSDGIPAIDLAQALALEAKKMSVAGVTLKDTWANLGGLTVAQIGAFGKLGVERFWVTSGDAAFTQAQAKALADLGSDVELTVPQNKVAELSLAAGQSLKLTGAEITQLAVDGLMELKTGASIVIFDVDQAKALAQDSGIALSLAKRATIELADTAANIDSLTTDQIASLHELGVGYAYSTSGDIILSSDQTSAFAAANIVLGVTAAHAASAQFTGDGALKVSAGVLTLTGSGLTVDESASSLTVSEGSETLSLQHYGKETIDATAATDATFSFSGAFGTDTLKGFKTGDTIAFAASDFGNTLSAANPYADYAAMLRHTTFNNAGAHIAIGSHVVILEGITKSELSAAEFRFT